MSEVPVNFLSLETTKVAAIGLGCVELPLVVEFGKRRPVVGFDINKRRIEALLVGHDKTLEVEDAELASAEHLSFTTAHDNVADCNVYIVTVPPPIDAHKRPDLTPLIEASKVIGKVLKPGDIVVYEPSVYPGALEVVSGHRFNKDFFAGYT